MPIIMRLVNLAIFVSIIAIFSYVYSSRFHRMQDFAGTRKRDLIPIKFEASCQEWTILIEHKKSKGGAYSIWHRLTA